jgi:hypothetical protein
MAHDGPVLWATFSPDGRRIATASADGTATIWDARSGRPLTAPMRHSRPVGTVAFSADGLLLATGDSRGHARLWDARSGEPLGPSLSAAPDVSASGGVVHATFSPDGRTLLWQGRWMDGQHALRLLPIAGDTRPVETIDATARFGSGRFADPGGASLFLPADSLVALGKQLLADGVLPSLADPTARVQWHRGQAQACQWTTNQWGARFHETRLRQVESE